MATKKRHDNHGLRKRCKCPRRAWPKCQHSWFLNYQPRGGKPYRLSLDQELHRHIESKTEAAHEAAAIRARIDAGTFGVQAPQRDVLTLRQLSDTYQERYVAVDHSATADEYRYALGTICRTVVPRPTGGTAPLGDWRVADIVTDTVERFRETRLAQRTGVVGVNRNVRQLRALFNWAIRVGYVEATPFLRGSQPVVKLAEEAPRSRRLHDGEEAQLRGASGPYLRAVIDAALESGMRSGEILSLQWYQIERAMMDGGTISWGPKAELFLPKEKTKTKRDRRIPISTRLKAVLEMRRLDPAGTPLPSTAYVFGNEIGQAVGGFKRAWQTAVLKSHGHTPSYTKTSNLTAESRAALAAIDLHFHDLRREAGSRWMDAHVPLATIQRWLGHSNISQTSTYLAGTPQSEHEAMARYDAHVQQSATGGRDRGAKAGLSAEPPDTNPNESAISRNRPIM